MSPRKKVKQAQIGQQLCMSCVYVKRPRNLSLQGVPTLASCPFSEYAVLYQRDCENGHYKPK